MKLGLSTWSFLKSDVYSAAKTIGDAGFDFIELWGEIPHAYQDLVDRKKLKDLLSTYDAQVTLHAPFTDLNPAVPYGSLRAAVTGTLTDFVKFGDFLNVSRITVHPGSVHSETLVSASMGNAVSVLRELVRSCHGRIELNIENQVKSLSPYHFPLGSNPESIYTLLSAVEDSNLTLDTGHAHVSGVDLLATYERFRDSITEIHLNDNDGSSDDHLAPGQGTAKLDGLLERANGTDVAICLELNPFKLSPDGIMGAAESLKASLRRANSPIRQGP